MALFDKQQTDVNKALKKLSAYTNIVSSQTLSECYICINDINAFSEIVDKLNEMITSMNYMYNLEDVLNYVIKELYPVIVKDKNNLTVLYNIVGIYLKNKSIISKVSINNMLQSFDDKAIVSEIYNYLTTKVVEEHPENIEILTSYFVKARQYYLDDRSLFSSFVNLVEKMGTDIINYAKKEQIEEAINEKLQEDKKANGIYDIDEAQLAEIDRKIESLGVQTKSLNTLIDLAEKETNRLRNVRDNIEIDCGKIRANELKKLSKEANRAIKEFNATYLELVNKQNTEVIAEKDKLISEIDAEIEKRKVQLLNVAESVSKTVALELTRIKNASNNSIGQIESYVSNNENVQRVIQDAKSNEDLVAKLAFVETVVAQNDGKVQEVEGKKIVVPTSGSEIVQNVGSVFVPTTEIIKGTELDAKPVNQKINYYFDKSHKFKERYKKLMELKAKMESKGEIFHEKFNDILTMIVYNDTPYMYGPSGCGKTYMVEHQLAKMLDLEVITNGYIQYEQDIIGYTNAGDGGYVPSNFYRAYKTGKIIFFDEIDNSNSNATTILNSFLTQDLNQTYTFPNGVPIKRHPNFRIISAGNTKGTGRTSAHNTRQKMDEAVMQRLTPIAVTYDNRIEKEILKDYPGWYEFSTVFRKAIEAIPNDSGEDINSIGTFTTRDAQRVKEYLDDEAMTYDQLIDYQIIENKDEDYLSQIFQGMSEHKFETKQGNQIMKLFKRKVDKRNGNSN